MNTFSEENYWRIRETYEDDDFVRWTTGFGLHRNLPRIRIMDLKDYHSKVIKGFNQELAGGGPYSGMVISREQFSFSWYNK